MIASLWGWPAVSSRVLPLKLLLCTTNVSPSQCPTESPNHDGSTFFACGRPSMGISLNQVFCS